MQLLAAVWPTVYIINIITWELIVKDDCLIHSSFCHLTMQASYLRGGNNPTCFGEIQGLSSSENVYYAHVISGELDESEMA